MSRSQANEVRSMMIGLSISLRWRIEILRGLNRFKRRQSDIKQRKHATVLPIYTFFFLVSPLYQLIICFEKNLGACSFHSSFTVSELKSNKGTKIPLS